MKKIITFLSCLLCSAYLYAAPGDTTIIKTHNATKLSWHQAYDTIAVFPDGTNTYNKIIMEFELGKYACPGYNPSNPGEGTGQTGWCADWDYDVHVIICAPNGDTVELGRLITPYANSNFPRTPGNWSHSYYYDVSDFYPLLKDSLTVRIFYAGWSGGFTGTVNFHMIEGTPVRDVVGYDILWQNGYRYGDTTANKSINDLLPAFDLNYPSNATSAAVRSIITGHGGDQTQNCAEFCKKWYRLAVNDSLQPTVDIWRNDCGSNFLYPQSGTWVYNRANWCPGDQVSEIIHPIPATVSPNDSFNLQLRFQDYLNTKAGEASYKIAATLFYYGDVNADVDANLTAIISPNNEETYYRHNPICGDAEIKVRNEGKQIITSIDFEYGIAGATLQTYTWSGSINSLAEQAIFLPSIAAFGAPTQQSFIVKIKSVNGVNDDNEFNNTLETTFTGAPIWEEGVLMFHTKNIGGAGNTLKYEVKDANSNIVFTKTVSGSGQENKDLLELPNGCYELNVTTTAGLGLAFFNYYTKGFFRIYDVFFMDTAKIALPKTDLANSGLEANFGNGFTQHFSVTKSKLHTDNIENPIGIMVYPNPANDLVQLKVLGNVNEKATVTIFNILGQQMQSLTSEEKVITINTASLSTGIYTIVYQTGSFKKVEKLIIEK